MSEETSLEEAIADFWKAIEEAYEQGNVVDKFFAAMWMGYRELYRKITFFSRRLEGGKD